MRNVQDPVPDEPGASRRSEERFRLLSGVSARLLATDNPQALVNELCAEVMAFLDCQVFFNFLVHEPSGRLQLNAYRGISPEEAQELEGLDNGVAVCGCAAKECVRIVAEDVQNGSDARTALVRGFGVQAYACHPLLAGKRVLGTLSFGARNRRSFSGEDLELMKTVADQVAVAMSRIESSAEIERREAEMRTVVEAIEEGVVVATLDGRLNHWNPAAIEMHGFQSLEECQRSLPDFAEIFELSAMDGTILPVERWPLARILDGEVLHDWEVRVRRRQGDWQRIFSYAGALVRDRDGRPLMAVVTVGDVTERKRTEELLRRTNERLEQMVAVRTEQLEERARQLRALAGELTLAEQRERRRMAKVLHDHLQQLLVAAKFRVSIVGHIGDTLVRQAAEEVENLLGESIETSRSLTAELSPPILHEGGLGAGLEWLARWMSAKHGLRVDLSLEPDVPQAAEDVGVLLFESARELLLNAVKHARVHSVTMTLRAVQPGMLRITVADQGVGFDAAAAAPAREKGAGYGLFSIRERLELVGGSMEIDSGPGKGSRIALIVPAAPDAASSPASPAPPAAAEARAAEAPSPGRTIRVLLVDDHIVMREGLARLLAQEPDMEIAGEAADGEEAVRQASLLQPDVILMDLSMPRMNGVEATRIIVQESPEIRIIGLSMFEEAERSQAMREAGAADYVTKSDAASRLIAAIRGAVHGRSAARSS